VFFEIFAIIHTAYAVLKGSAAVRTSAIALLAVITAISMTETNAKWAEMCVACVRLRPLWSPRGLSAASARRAGRPRHAPPPRAPRTCHTPRRAAAPQNPIARPRPPPHPTVASNGRFLRLKTNP
jgi:hypothetical protein